MKTPIEYCAALTKAQDYPRYICSLFLPDEARAAAWALFAWNAEIAGIASAVSEEMIGLIRFTWWKEALDEIYEGRAVRKHPVAQALAEVMQRHGLPRDAFDALLLARERDLQPLQFTTREELLAYARNISVPLIGLVAESVQRGTSQNSDVMAYADAVGEAWALAGMMRALPYYIQRGDMIFPQENMEGKALSAAVREIIDHVSSLLKQASAIALPPALKPLRIFACYTHVSLRRLKAVRGDVFHPRLKTGKIADLLQLLWLQKFS